MHPKAKAAGVTGAVATIIAAIAVRAGVNVDPTVDTAIAGALVTALAAIAAHFRGRPARPQSTNPPQVNP